MCEITLPLWQVPRDWAGVPWHGWRVSLGRNRDSSCLENSNFECALEQIKSASDKLSISDKNYDEIASVQVVCENHWLVGWVEWIAVHESDKGALEKAQEIANDLEEYSVLNEDDFSRREYEEYQESWESWGRRDYQRALENKLAEHYKGRMSEEWTDEEILDAIGELETSEVDELRNEAAKNVDWEYQSEGSGVTINIDGLAEKTDMDKLSDLAIEVLVAQQQSRDIAKLARIAGADDGQIKLAVSL